jgi:hypothetical protein
MFLRSVWLYRAPTNIKNVDFGQIADGLYLERIESRAAHRLTVAKQRPSVHPEARSTASCIEQGSRGRNALHPPEREGNNSEMVMLGKGHGDSADESL